MYDRTINQVGRSCFKRNRWFYGYRYLVILMMMFLCSLGGANGKAKETGLKEHCPKLYPLLQKPPNNQSQLLAMAEGTGYCQSIAQLILGNYYVARRAYQQAYYWWLQSAQQKNAKAQYNLALMYHKGQGIKKDDTQALYWMQQAAENGTPLTQYQLGLAYFKGIFGVKDTKKMAYWIGRAAEKNYPVALRVMGYLYSHGIGVSADMAKSAQYYERAAVLGDPVSMYNMGFHYEFGLGVKKDSRMAVMWMQKALSRKVRCAANDLGRLYALGEGVKQNKIHAISYFKYALLMDTGQSDAVWRNSYMHFNEIQAEIYGQYMYAKFTGKKVNLSDSEQTFAEKTAQKFLKMCWQ